MYCFGTDLLFGKQGSILLFFWLFLWRPLNPNFKFAKIQLKVKIR